MSELAFTAYTPPKQIKTHAFTVRLTDEEHARLLAWMAACATGDSMRRAVAVEEMVAAFLDRNGVPRDLKLLDQYRHQARLKAVPTWIEGECKREAS